MNTTSDADKYLSGLGADTPNRSKKGTFNYDSLAGAASPAAGAAAPKSTPAQKSAPTTRTPTTVIPTGVRCQVNNRRIKEVFEELRRLKPGQFPNTSAVMLRILLELCVAHHMEKSGKLKPILDKARNKEGKGRDWSPTLRQMLVPLIEGPDVDIEPQALKRVKKLVQSQKDSPFSLDDLDHFVHNQYVAPTAREVFALWEILSGLFKLIFVEPAPPTKAPGPKK